MRSMHVDSVKLEIVEAGQHDADLVSIMVYQLLSEVSETSGTRLHVSDEEIYNTCHMLFEEEGHKFTAFLAFAQTEDTGIRKPVGVMTLTETVALYAKGRFGQIMEFFVDPNFRSRRVGVRLLHAAIEHGKEKAWSCLEVNAPDIIGGPRAISFYNREGFTNSGPSMKLCLR
ncbi:GNAT family N-acetyltransferase [Curvivirga sp.]|uniref:GNAT family N-acetyltransferase n=1 Tax=Curvivirga sp. TaxID=2856848 RepID=UPI003B5C7E5E